MNKNVKCINYVLPYEEYKKHECFKNVHTAADLRNFIKENINKDCAVGDYPFIVCFVINFVIENDDEVEKLFKQLKQYGVIKVLKSHYKEIDDVEYTMIKYNNIEITEEILNNYKREEL